MTNTAADDWVTRGFGERARDLSGVVRAVADLGVDYPGRRWVWRGVPDATWRVQSSLWRHLTGRLPDGLTINEATFREHERRVLRRARSWGLGLDATNYVPDLHLLASLQHHGVPTRLLDVTTNPYTALWFTTGNRQEIRSDGVLLAIDVTDIPTEQTVPLLPRVTSGSVADPTGWQLASALARSHEQATTFLVQPTVRDARMTAQEGLFLTSAVPDPTLSAPVDMVDGLAINPAKTSRLDVPTPDRSDPFDLYGTTALRALVIPAAIKEGVRGWLNNTHSLARQTLFPDLGGLADYYRDLPKYGHHDEPGPHQ